MLLGKAILGMTGLLGPGNLTGDLLRHTLYPIHPTRQLSKQRRRRKVRRKRTSPKRRQNYCLTRLISTSTISQFFLSNNRQQLNQRSQDSKNRNKQFSSVNKLGHTVRNAQRTIVVIIKSIHMLTKVIKDMELILIIHPTAILACMAACMEVNMQVPLLITLEVMVVMDNMDTKDMV